MYEKFNTFYLEPEKWEEPFILNGSEAHHLARVLRIPPASKVRLINGEGRSGIFTVKDISRKQIRLEPETITAWPEPVSRMHLALAWNKSFRRSWLLEKAVELGVWKILLWQARRSQGRTRDAVQDNWRGKMIAAAKQCENPWLPEIIFMHDQADELVSHASGIEAKILLWEEEKDAVLLEYYQERRPLEKIVVVGPEGGLTEEEAGILIESGFTSLSLGPRVLRWETAALAPLYLDMLFFSNSQGPADTV